MLFEKSPKEIQEIPMFTGILFQQTSHSTGLELELPEICLLFALDIFRRDRQRHKLARTSWNAMAAVLRSDDRGGYRAADNRIPPSSKTRYMKSIRLCRNMERVYGNIFSRAAMLDRNTAEYMIDEMQNEITQHKEMLKKVKDELGEKAKELEEKLDELRGKDKELQGKDKELQGMGKELKEKDKELQGMGKELKEKDKELEKKNDEIKENRITLITQIRNLASVGFSAEKCANMLVADIGTVNKAYEAIKEYPESSDARILELLEQ